MKDKHDNSTIDWVDTPNPFTPSTRSQFKQLLNTAHTKLLTPAECDRLVEVLEQQLEQSNKQLRINNKTLAHS
jgi:hypothetical protein